MRLAPAILWTAFSISIVFAQQPARRGHAATPAQPAGRQVGAIKFGSRKFVKSHAAVVPEAVAPAPGVVQVHMEEGQVFAYFVATSPIPASTQQFVTLTIDDGSGNPSSLQFDAVSNSFNTGDYLTLPTLDNLTDLQPSLLVTYTVDIVNGRTTTEANGYFLTGSALGNGDFANFAPVITGTSQRIAANKDMILVINGAFTTDTPLVVLEGNVPPAGAITRVSTSEIDVDLSQVTGLDLTALTEYLLTVSQAGFADTLLYRYAPPAPNTFNLAPQ
jgi:hypothetical protein